MPKNQDAEFTRAICPYCGVGCGQMIFHKDGELISIEGDPGSRRSRAAISVPRAPTPYELHTHPNRLMTVKYRRPYATEWEEIDLETAMDMVADSVWETRERSFVEKQDGETVMQTTAMAHLGGATLDNEENYLIKKLFYRRSGHGLHQQPGPDMTQLHGARSGHLVRTRRRDHRAAGSGQR